ncbi:MAG TPA: DUF5678 domain-containing protein [Thermoplasmata archaeon]|jgi:hypothetical protein
MEESAGRSNDEWFEANLLDLVGKYPHRWIAVLDGAVICTAASRGGAQAEAKRIAAGREFSLYFIEPSVLQMGFTRGRSPPGDRS